MKIAIIADPIDEQYAGIYVYAKEFVQALERNNREHDIYYIHLRENDFFQGMKEIIVPLKRNIPLWATLRKFLWLPWIFRKQDFDIVHDLSHIAPFTFFGGKYKKVVTIHDLTPVLFPKWHIFASRVVHRLIFPLIFRKADLVVCDSNSTKNDVLSHYKVRGRIETVHLAARSSVIRKDRNEAKEYLAKNYEVSDDFLLYIGTLEPRKNLGFLLELFNKLKREKVFLGKLVLVGKKGWFLRDFHEQLNTMERDVQKDIILTDYIPEEDLSFFYSAAELFIYPSLYEGFGLPPLEAMKCGVPTMVARNSSLTEVVGNAGICLPTDSLGPWFTEAKLILQDQDYRAKLLKSAKEQTENFSWDKHIKTVLQLYREIQSGKTKE
jgi:glycosyltransferase involved in cell wall biosynthesis